MVEPERMLLCPAIQELVFKKGWNGIANFTQPTPTHAHTPLPFGKPLEVIGEAFVDGLGQGAPGRHIPDNHGRLTFPTPPAPSSRSVRQ